MAAGLSALFDQRKLALTRARLHAWWEGEAFDEAAALAAIAEKLKAADQNGPSGADQELFDEPPLGLPPRLLALAALWGEGRIRPGDAAAETEALAALGLGADGVLAVLGAGHAAPLIALASTHAGKIEAFEWREETLEALQYGVRKARLEARVSVVRIDLEAHVFTPEAYDGLISIDDFAYCGYPPHLAHQIVKCLKPGAPALLDCYVGLRGQELATAFASSFAEPQIRSQAELLQFFTDSGLTLESEDDITGAFMACARQGFKDLAGRLNEKMLEPAAARELAWEAEAWRMRLKLLGQRRLERRRFLVRKPAGDAPMEAAPETPETPDTQEPNAQVGALGDYEDKSGEILARLLAEQKK
jgi:cyclopropane fatty-acyl-phospholipid synthase-like methyltransferase